MFQLGLGCVFLTLGVIRGQLYVRGCQGSRRGKDSPELVRYWSYPWNQRPVVGTERGRRGPRDRRELNDSGQHELDPGDEGEIWLEASPERVVTPSPEIKRDRAPIRADFSGQESQLEGQKRFRRS